MTPEILAWIQTTARKHIAFPGDVLEVGSQNINGSPRALFGDAQSYTGTDMQAGAGVDYVINNTQLLTTFGADAFDTVLCCECLEHDFVFWSTVQQLRQLVRVGGHLVITTPHFGFPEHRYPSHYVNFGQDAYREWFFAGMNICDLRLLETSGRPDMTVVGIARRVE